MRNKVNWTVCYIPAQSNYLISKDKAEKNRKLTPERKKEEFQSNTFSFPGKCSSKSGLGEPDRESAGQIEPLEEFDEERPRIEEIEGFSSLEEKKPSGLSPWRIGKAKLSFRESMRPKRGRRRDGLGLILREGGEGEGE